VSLRIRTKSGSAVTIGGEYDDCGERGMVTLSCEVDMNGCNVRVSVKLRASECVDVERTLKRFRESARQV
jgi:hypothetical protein